MENGRRAIILALLGCFAAHGHAWELETVGEIRGKVLDKGNMQRVEWVNVSVVGTPYGTFSDEEGTFRTLYDSIELPNSSHFGRMGSSSTVKSWTLS